MANNDPYKSPQAGVSSNNATNETYQPKFFSMHGRIGRIRYLAYTLGVYLLMIPFGAVIAALGGGSSTFSSQGSSATSIIAIILIAILVIVGIFGIVVVTKRRFNDLNHSGWFSVLIFIPYIGIIPALYLMFFPGTKVSNRFGAKPVKNTLFLWIVGLALPVIFVVGILAAVAIPAYSDYVERVSAAQALQAK